MSVRIMSMVFQSYPAGGGEMLLALALADHADDRGENIFPSVGYLATKTRQSERTVQRQLADMVYAGWLQVVTPGGHGKRSSTRYRVNPAWIQQTATSQAVLDAPSKGDKLSPLEPPQGDTGVGLGRHPRQLRVTQLCHPNHQEPSRTISSREPRATAPPAALSDPPAAAVDPLGGGKTERVIAAMAVELRAGRAIQHPAAFAAKVCGDKKHIPERWGEDLLGWAKARLELEDDRRRERSAEASRRQQLALERSREEGARALEALEGRKR